ncbi:Solute carrier family 25 member 11 [Balamuthia mandrillaris]
MTSTTPTAAAEPFKGSSFVFGGLSGMMATCIVQPIDLIKTRMQLSGEKGAARAHKSSFHALVNIAKQEGIVSLYKGLSAGLLRQATYTTARLGAYDWLSANLPHKEGQPLPFGLKLLAGLSAGGFGAVIGTPAEVALIRMTSDGRLPPEQRRNYKNAFDALYRMSKEEGVLTLWRGCSPTVIRAMILNACQLASYTQAKQMILSTGYLEDGVPVHFLASLCSGFLSTVVSMPVDITKTRIQTMRIINGVPEYSGVVDVLRQVVKNEGFFSLWKGFTPYFLRLGPHTIFTFLFLEQFKKAFYH